MVPRNNEYLQKHSADVRGGPSPAQASDAPTGSLQSPNSNSHQTSIRLSVDSAANKTSTKKASDFATVMKRLSASYAAASKTTATVSTKISPASSECSISSFTNQPKVSLSRLKVEHVHSMEVSLTEFAKQDPAVAIKLGVIEKKVEESDAKTMKDMFTMMKADERKAIKRVNTSAKDDDEIGQCRCISFRLLFIINMPLLISLTTKNASYSAKAARTSEIHQGRCHQITDVSAVYEEHGA